MFALLGHEAIFFKYGQVLIIVEPFSKNTCDFLFQFFNSLIFYERLHLGYRYFVQLYKSFILW